MKKKHTHTHTHTHTSSNLGSNEQSLFFFKKKLEKRTEREQYSDKARKDTRYMTRYMIYISLWLMNFQGNECAAHSSRQRENFSIDSDSK